MLCAISSAAEDEHTLAHAALSEGRADDALALLRPMTSTNPQDAEAQNLLCRVLLSEERPDDALQPCERAASLAPDNAHYQLWLAHANGSKAEHASPLTALSIARRARDHFEAAARLAPNDWGILSDLGEFYVEAPGIAGGGIEKARRLLPRLMQLNTSRGHWLAAKLAEENKDYVTAESEYKQAIATGSNVPEGWVNLASFYRRRGRLDEADDCVHKAEQADSDHDSVLVDAATVLRMMNREDVLAIRMLLSYLASDHRSESAPAFAVHCTLGQILQHEGSRAAAIHEYAAALELAHDYAPALRGMRSR
jgi:tetratricopeptide (TPR) repeat protein